MRNQILHHLLPRKSPKNVQLDTTNVLASNKLTASGTISVGKSHKKSLDEEVAEVKRPRH
jgi:phosphoenolpyruvate-protein kinase (PTS system EI component)